MSTSPGRPNHPACALEPHAQQFLEGGDGAGERAPWLGGAVPGAPADDGTPHPRGEQVVEGPTEDGAGPRQGEASPASPEGKEKHPYWPRALLSPEMTVDFPKASVSLLALPHFCYSLRNSRLFPAMCLLRGLTVAPSACTQEHCHALIKNPSVTLKYAYWWQKGEGGGIPSLLIDRESGFWPPLIRGTLGLWPGFNPSTITFWLCDPG